MAWEATVLRWALDRLWERLFPPRDDAPPKPASVGERLLELAADHGMTPPQLLGLVPAGWGWTAVDVRDAVTLDGVLNDSRIGWLAATFGVRRAWLDGCDERVYEPVWLYKRIASLPDALRGAGGWPGDPRDLEAALLVPGRGLDQRHGRAATLVFSTPLRRADGEPLVAGDCEVRRWVVCGDAWIWDHYPCRGDLKLLGHFLWEDLRASVPIYPADEKVAGAIREGRLVPRPHVPWQRGGYARLEDYATGPGSARAREPEEWEETLSCGRPTLDKLRKSLGRTGNAPRS